MTRLGFLDHYQFYIHMEIHLEVTLHISGISEDMKEIREFIQDPAEYDQEHTYRGVSSQ